MLIEVPFPESFEPQARPELHHLGVTGCISEYQFMSDSAWGRSAFYDSPSSCSLGPAVACDDTHVSPIQAIHPTSCLKQLDSRS